MVGAGQAGLAVGYHLARHRHHFVILDAADSVGASWPNRWDSLRLFTPAGFTHLPGLAFPAARSELPGKDAVADYLASYAEHFALPVELNSLVESVRRQEDGFLVVAGSRRWQARNVVLATGAHAAPVVPAFADEVDPGIVQVHASDYRAPDQLPGGVVLVVGAGNSGAEIALDLARVRAVPDGLPHVGDGTTLEPDAIVWCTGLRPDYSYLDLDVFDEHGRLQHRRGVVAEEPGLYVVGLPYQRSITSHLLGGVGVDAKYVVDRLISRRLSRLSTPSR